MLSGTVGAFFSGEEAGGSRWRRDRYMLRWRWDGNHGCREAVLAGEMSVYTRDWTLEWGKE